MLMWLVMAVLAPSQDPVRKTVETPHLTVTTSAAPDAAASGSRVSLHVDISPKPRMHVYSPGQEGYIAITLALDADPRFASTAKAKYPAAEKYYMPALKETQLVYAKPFRITQDIAIKPPSVHAGETLTIKGTLRYQACDENVCYLPVNVPVTWNIRIANP